MEWWRRDFRPLAEWTLRLSLFGIHFCGFRCIVYFLIPSGGNGTGVLLINPT